MMFDFILFDLDGTLTNPFEGITNSVAYALNKYGITVEDKRKLINFIGPPLDYSFIKYYGFDKDKAQQAIKFYREYYTAKGMLENEVIAGVEDTLEKLVNAGKKLYVATSKPEEYSLKIIKHFGLDKYFCGLAGATLDYTRVKKEDVIAYTLNTFKLTDKSQVLMVGDRAQDVSGAKANGIKCVGVLYGFGDREELENAGADYIITSPEELLKIVSYEA